MNAKQIFPIILGSIVFFASCKSKEEKTAAIAPLQVTVQTVQASSGTQQLNYSGTIEPDNTAQIGFAVSGVVNMVSVQEGQFVKQGQLLASIDASEYVNGLAIANAGLQQAEDLYKRLSELYEKGSLPERDFIDIKTKLAQARANKSINEKHIADSRLYAPMSGIVTAKLAVRGSTAAPGVAAFTIVKTDEVYAKVSVPESEIGSIQKGKPASIFIPTLNDSLNGVISIINPQADAASKTYSVKIRLYNSAGKLLPGMIANVSINTSKKASLITIPATAVVRDADDISYVFVANINKKAVRKRVTTGALAGSNGVTVTQGLQAGETIVTEGQSKLKDGAAISF
jgi:membrane fusion protein (multidrug efflux system)